MESFRKEYFNDYCYFLIENDGDKFVLNYSLYDNNLTESKHKENKIKFEKKNLKKVVNGISKVLKKNKKVTKQEIDELVDEDGTFLSSRIKILNKWLTPRKTMDQTVVAARISNDPVTRGYRVYYGEGLEKDDNVIDEINMKDVFGYKETKNKDFKETVKTFEKMGIDDPIERIERAEELGKIRNQKRKKGKLKQRLTEKEIEEIQKEKMTKMVEDILTKKSNKSNNDFIEKDDDNTLSRILMKNLESIKKLAKKEGISLNKLINVLKQGE